MRRWIAVGLAALAGVSGAWLGGLGPNGSAPAAADVAAAAAAHAGSGRPLTVPVLQRWSPGSADFTLRGGARIVVSSAEYAQLTTTAAVLHDDLAAATGADLKIVTGSPRDGDIVLRLGPVPDVGKSDEGYRVAVGRRLVVTGLTDAGVFNGTRTVLQLLRQNRTVPGGTATDWPAYPERGLLLDLGRKYFSTDWLHARIREMADLKLNYLHLHLSDVYGFRLESATHPEIVAPQHYTKAEISSLIGYAAARHIVVVPEIDMPGHMDAILAAHPDLRLTQADGTPAPGFIDLANPAAYPLMQDLLTEFLPLFPGPYWSIGADEYSSDAAAQSGFYHYLRWADGLVRAAGKTARAWDDGLRPDRLAAGDVPPGLVVDYWSTGGPTPWSKQGVSPQQLAEAGHPGLNLAYIPTYYTLGKRFTMLNATPATMYESWDPGRYVGDTRLSPRDQPLDLGSMVSLWCDDPTAEDEPQIAADLAARLPVMAQSTWGSPKPGAGYQQFLAVLRAVGGAPAA